MSLSGTLPSIRDLSTRIALLPLPLQEPCAHLLKTAEFRSASTIFAQMEQLRCALAVSWEHLAVLYNTPKTTLHKRWKAYRRQQEPAEEFLPPTVEKVPPHSNLTPAQEIEIIQWIHERQKQSRCPTVHEVPSSILN